ncbi:hypothetical protein SCHPADRAFT_604791 [Schizopora paradoxa]|uniref:DUF1793-domain-containing protein n=1 Tax=Schizopora paradoxa TaxID=27342 RepID=A0A0H2RG95_9AGAM|nr:hypothetical protein SCHPADRAFT_604791 [Schizopora paradoxa]
MASRLGHRRCLWSSLSCIAFALCASLNVFAQNTPFTPPAWPLAVKNPYLNGWLVNTAELNSGWPVLWTPSFDILGWYCSVVVDGVPYRILSPGPLPDIATAKQLSVDFTPTKTTFVLEAGPFVINATFMSTVTPNDLVRQSLPFSYFYVSARSSDGLPHTFKIYSDISSEWISGDDNAPANASSIGDNESVILETQLQGPLPFTEIKDHPQDASGFYAASNGENVTYEVIQANVSRTLFANGTGLDGFVDPLYNTHGLGRPFFDVFAIATDLGNITETSSPIVWAIGVTRDPSIQFSTPLTQKQMRSSFYRSNLSTPDDVASFFLADFNNSLVDSESFDTSLLAAAQNISMAYGDLLALTVRQAMSALEITGSKNSDGSFNTSDVMIFMKDMGGVGTGGVNAVDVLFAAFPMYLYLNPALGGCLLRPLLEGQDNDAYDIPFAAQDLGTQFPTATLSNVQHDFGIEQSANMIIMSLAHAMYSGDDSLLDQHYGLLKNWTDYLVNNTMDLGLQQPSLSDGFAAFNRTNLALKGIIGISAMSKIAAHFSRISDETQYKDVASSYLQTWLSKAISTDRTHLLSVLDQQQSSGILYNLYADKLLHLDLIPDSVYDLQTSYFSSQLDTSSFGIPLDSGNLTLSRSAAVATTNDVRDGLISLMHAYAATTANLLPLSAIYNPINGQALGGENSPSMGAMFSLLALE